MARKQAGDIVISKDKFRQVRQVREDEVAKKAPEWTPPPPPKLNKGDSALCHHKALFFTIPKPCVIADIRPDKGYTSGYKMLVIDNAGNERWLNSSYFNPAP